MVEQVGRWPVTTTVCEGPGCVVDVAQGEGGQPRRFCSDGCRLRAWREHRRGELAGIVAGLALEAHPSVLVAALAALPDASLRHLRTRLSGATEGLSFHGSRNGLGG